MTRTALLVFPLPSSSSPRGRSSFLQMILLWCCRCVVMMSFQTHPQHQHQQILVEAAADAAAAAPIQVNDDNVEEILTGPKATFIMVSNRGIIYGIRLYFILYRYWRIYSIENTKYILDAVIITNMLPCFSSSTYDRQRNVVLWIPVSIIYIYHFIVVAARVIPRMNE